MLFFILMPPNFMDSLSTLLGFNNLTTICLGVMFYFGVVEHLKCMYIFMFIVYFFNSQHYFFKIMLLPYFLESSFQGFQLYICRIVLPFPTHFSFFFIFFLLLFLIFVLFLFSSSLLKIFIPLEF